MHKLMALCAVAFLSAGISQARAADEGMIKRPAPGCVSRDAMRRVHDLREQHDGLAARALIDDGLASGACRWFVAGEPVIIEDGDILADISKVHTLGDPQPFWVSHRALED
jgi:hypothetical protein